MIRAVRDGGAWASLLAVTSLVRAGAETLLPAVLGLAVDGVLRDGGTSTWPLAYAALVAAATAGDVLTELAIGTSAAAATARMRHRFVRRLLALGPSAGTRRSPGGEGPCGVARRASPTVRAAGGSGDESTRGAHTSPGLAAGDVTSRAVTATADTGLAPSAVVLAITAVLPPVGGMIALLLLDPWLALTFALGLPVIFAVLTAFVRDTSAIVGRYLAVQGVIAARLVEALAGNRTVAAAGTADREITRILAPLPELAEHGHATWRVQAATAGRGTLALPLLQIAVLAVAGWEVAAGRLTAGGLLAATQYAGLGADIGPVITQLGRLARARAGAARLAPVLDREPPAYGTASPPEGPGRLEFRGVSAAPVLDGLDLTVPGGRAVAVVGRSGSGKSLLAALAGRLAEPDAGEVLLDGVPLRDLSRTALRRAIGYAFARPVLFGATIAEAITGGTAPAPPADRSGAAAEAVPAACAMRAACAAQADGFIRRLPAGYGTPPDAAPLSGGELQRLGLARAFAHPGTVLVLDDATSSLDTVTEMRIGDILTRDPRTRLIIAHRVTTAARADLVAWLDGGRIRACAPHRELWADPEYRAVFR
ncbi:ABC transporter ATP-binding protein/permease [Actinoallomurus spadix]|uniref:ATP-binding cassette domain-containing protein n=1 Tax=Actinoallomurus spadix TaxID=79912 RepID=UPI00209239DC|nr:ABC transporter ATP-binding protein [Actinoallomurus spadix]MCO5989204.1 ABC transporter ATP-binding protein/permease [Actinoallomurus spadix]